MNLNIWLLIGLGTASAVGLACVKPIRQDLKYHNFADQRRMLGRLHALNVWSNAPFVGVGIAGLWWLFCGSGFPAATGWLGEMSRQECRSHMQGVWWIWMAFFVGVVLTGLGFGYYHLRPCNETLVWDRVGMTTAFAPFFTGIIAERISQQAGIWMFVPAMVVGIGSVLYWKRTDDLRLYAWVQFFPMLAIPLLAWLSPAKYLAARDIFIVIGWYAVAKVFESVDKPFLRWTGMSGHSWKHIFAAAGCGWVLVALAR